VAGEIDYYIAAIADSIEQVLDEGLRSDGACTLPISRIVKHYTTGGQFNTKLLLSDKILIDDALNKLKSDGHIDVWDDDFSETVIYIPNPQSLFDSLTENEPFQRLYMLKDNGHSWLANALAQINLGRQEPTRSVSTPNDTKLESEIDRWEPLQIDPNDDQVAEVIQQLEGAVKSIAGDNGFAVELPAERDNLVTHAQATVDAAKAGRITKAQITQHFMAAGRWLSDKFGGTVIGTLGAELAKWGLRLLGMLP
jgi:hypothetical protein